MSNTLPYADHEQGAKWARGNLSMPDDHTSPVDLNTACLDDLCSVPGIGPTLAQRIISFRSEHGPFSDASELARVPRIGSRTLARLSERVSIYGRLSSHGSDPALPLSLGTFGCPPPANVSVDTGAPKVDAAPEVIEKQGDKLGASQADLVSRLERRHRFGLGIVCALATMTGLFGGYCLTQASGPAVPGPQVAQVSQVEAVHHEIQAQLERQSSDISSATAAVTKVAERQASFEAATHAEQARVAQEVTDLSERTKKAQARTDARVYNLGEATKLIDWATSGGYASKATSSLP
jgi:competence ComEA-like helix-hairpin-helix protein